MLGLMKGRMSVRNGRTRLPPSESPQLVRLALYLATFITSCKTLRHVNTSTSTRQSTCYAKTRSAGASFSCYQYCLILCMLFSGLAIAEDPAKPLASSTVGIAKRVDSLIFPGAKLQVKPIGRSASTPCAANHQYLSAWYRSSL